MPGGVSDGRWHAVQVQYYNKVGRPSRFPLAHAASRPRCGRSETKKMCWLRRSLGREPGLRVRVTAPSPGPGKIPRGSSGRAGGRGEQRSPHTGAGLRKASSTAVLGRAVPGGESAPFRPGTDASLAACHRASRVSEEMLEGAVFLVRFIPLVLAAEETRCWFSHRNAQPVSVAVALPAGALPPGGRRTLPPLCLRWPVPAPRALPGWRRGASLWEQTWTGAGGGGVFVPSRPLLSGV